MQKSDLLITEMRDGSLEICVKNEEIGEICLGFLKQDDTTPKNFDDVLTDSDVQTFIRKAKMKAEKYVFILVRTDNKGIKYKYNFDTEEIEKICEIEPFSLSDSRLTKLLVSREISFRKSHGKRMVILAFLLTIILITRALGISTVIPVVLLGLTMWVTIYKWLHHIVNEKF